MICYVSYELNVAFYFENENKKTMFHFNAIKFFRLSYVLKIATNESKNIHVIDERHFVIRSA